jgi:hypothetical protein
MSNFVDTTAKPVLDFSSSFFEDPAYDLRFNQTQFHQYYSINGLSRSTDTVSFILPAHSSNVSYDLNNIYIAAGISILTDDYKIIPDDTEVSVINNCLLSAFKSVRVFLNDKIILNHSNYALFAYVNTLLNFDNSPKTTYLTNGGWSKDEAGQMNTFDKSATGFQNRKKYFSTTTGGVTRFMLSPCLFINKLMLGLDISSLPPGIQVRIELDRNPDEFFFLSGLTDKFKYELKSVCLFASNQTLNESLYVSLKKELQLKDARFHLTVPSIYQYTIPSTLSTYINDNLTYLSPPSKVVVMFQPTLAYTGKQDKNGFCFPRSFGTFSIKSVNLYLNSQHVDGLLINDDEGKMNYMRLFLMTNQLYQQNCANITYQYVKSL